MKILLVSHVLDRSATNGGLVLTRGAISRLENAGHIVIPKYVFERPVPLRSLRMLWSVLIAFVASTASKTLYFFRVSFVKTLRESISYHKPDLVLFDHVELWPYSKYVADGIATGCIFHNEEGKLFADRVSRTGLGLLPRLLKRDVARFVQIEIDAVRSCQIALFASRVDMQSLAKQAGLDESSGSKLIALDPFFSYKKKARSPASSPLEKIRIGFVGNLEWWPNQDAVSVFIEKIWKHSRTSAEFHIFGKGTERFSDPALRIFGHGFVKDIASIWQGADIFVNPINMGSGINIKVCEAIYNRLPIICSPLAVSGLPALPVQGLVILSTQSDWIEFLSDEDKLRHLALNGPEEGAGTFYSADMSGMASYLKAIEKKVEQV